MYPSNFSYQAGLTILNNFRTSNNKPFTIFLKRTFLQQNKFKEAEMETFVMLKRYL